MSHPTVFDQLFATLATNATAHNSDVVLDEDDCACVVSEVRKLQLGRDEALCGLAAARKALEPFALCEGYVASRQDWPDERPLWTRGRDGEPLYSITAGDLRAAARAAQSVDHIGEANEMIERPKTCFDCKSVDSCVEAGCIIASETKACRAFQPRAAQSDGGKEAQS